MFIECLRVLKNEMYPKYEQKTNRLRTRFSCTGSTANETKPMEVLLTGAYIVFVVTRVAMKS